MRGRVLLFAVLVLAGCGRGDEPTLEGPTSTPSTTTSAVDRAADLGVQSELRNALTAAKTIAVDSGGRFVDADGAPLDAADLASVEPSLVFVDDFPPEDGEVFVRTEPAGAHIVLVRTSQAGTSFCIAATSEGVVTYGAAPAADAVDAIDECSEGAW